jgi:hypothetical protein
MRWRFDMTDTLNIRLKSKGGSLSLSTTATLLQAQLHGDIKVLALEWIKRLAMGLNPSSVEDSRVEFVLQSTLDYIDALEGVLERLQADPDTSDELLEEIEKVLL